MNILPKSGTFLPGHPVYISLFMVHRLPMYSNKLKNLCATDYKTCSKLLVAQYETLLQHKIGERQRKAMKNLSE